MQKFRFKILVVLVFSFISLGQAYPYAVAYTHGGQHRECSCQRKGKSCQHGCDLKKRRQSRKAGRDCHSKPGHQPTTLAGHEVQERAIVQQNKQVAWVSPNCSRHQEQKVLSFHGDPFIPEVKTLDLALVLAAEVSISAVHPAQWINACDGPPPKEESDLPKELS